MPSVRVNETLIEYLLEGSGARGFLLLNGMGAHIGLWGEFATGLGELGSVLRFNFRGCGASSPPAAPLTLEDLASDAVALAGVLGIERPIVVGHAFGGRVAQVLARDRPGSLRALVICGTGGQFPPRPAPQMAVSPGHRTERELFDEAWLNQWCSPRFREQQPERARAVLDEVWRDRGIPKGTTALRAAIAATPSASYWGTATVPALLLYGDDDLYGTRENATDLHARLRGSALTFIPGAGHMAIREQPAAMLAAVRQFVEEMNL